MDVPAAEAATDLIPFFRRLRPDERIRLSERLLVVRLADGERLRLEPEVPRMAVVVEGEVALGIGGERVPLFAGDVVGEVGVVSGKGVAGELTASGAAVLATLDGPALDRILEQFPAVALLLLEDLGREMKWHADLLREVCLAQNEGLGPSQLEVLFRGRRRQLWRHRRFSLRKFGALLLRTLLLEPARRPAFWTFAGVSLALASARTVVAYIIKEGLQKRLFALIGGQTGHPMHIHHFNYGLLTVAVVGLLSMVPGTRRALRVLSFAFGFGVGLVVDEFALFWNLNPDYYQASSRLVAAVVLFVLVQIVYFRALYVAAARRLLSRVGL